MDALNGGTSSLTLLEPGPEHGGAEAGARAAGGFALPLGDEPALDAGRTQGAASLPGASLPGGALAAASSSAAAAAVIQGTIATDAGQEMAAAAKARRRQQRAKELRAAALVPVAQRTPQQVRARAARLCGGSPGTAGWARGTRALQAAVRLLLSRAATAQCIPKSAPL